MTVAFFDFDGTLVKGDSLKAFLFFYFRYNQSKLLLRTSFFLPYFIAHKLGIVSNNQSKAKLFQLFFKGEKRELFLSRAKQFSDEWIDKNLNTQVWNKLQWHKKKGHLVYVVSASIDTYLLPWINRNEIKLLCTEMDLSNDPISGKWKTPNCYGQEKVNRIVEEINVDSFEASYAYGDSKGDREMLELVDFGFYKSV